MYESECDVPVPGILVPGNLSLFLMVSEPVSENFGTEKSLGTGIGKIWYQKKVSDSLLVPEKMPVSLSKLFGTGKKYRYRYRLTSWVPSHTGR